MSAVTDALIKEIADAINTQAPQSKETRLIGTIDSIHTDGSGDTSRKFYKVKLDGSDTLTPALAACPCDIGDRVMVTIGEHSATITGNLSAALYIKSIGAFIQLVDDGLIVGAISEEGIRSGGYVKIKNSSFEFYSSGDEKLATYNSGSITFGPDDNPLATFSASLVNLLSGQGLIKVIENTLLLIGDVATGMRSEDTYGNRAEVVVRGSSPLAAALQVRMSGVTTSILLNAVNALVTVPFGALLVNNSEVLTVDSVGARGRIKITSNVEAGHSKNFTATAAVPEGYIISALREVTVYECNSSGESIGPNVMLRLMNFHSDPNTNIVGARIHNASASKMKVRVVIEWLAIKADGVIDEGDTDIILPD